MTPYYFAYGIMILPAIFFNYNTYKLKSRNKLIICILCFFSIFTLLGLRKQSMGVDLSGYLTSFDFLNQISWKKVLLLKSYLNYEKGFVLFSKLSGSIFNNRQFYIAICAFVSLAPIAYVFYKKSKVPLLSFIIYLGLPSFLIAFSGLRQAIALAVTFYSIKFIEDKKIFKFMLAIVVAMLFHKTAIIFLLAYPLFYVKRSNWVKFFSLCLVPIVYFLRYPLFYVLSKFFKENAIPDGNSAITLFLIFSLIYVFLLLLENSSNRKESGYINLFYCACIFQAFGGVYSTAMRVGYYFMIYLTLALPEIISSKSRNSKDRYIIYLIFFTCFASFGLYSIYNSSWAMAYPYKFFWLSN